jgi:hypothetical protein
MKTQTSPVLLERSFGSIVVRVPANQEISWFDGLLSSQHDLGASRAVGDYLRQVVECEG